MPSVWEEAYGRTVVEAQINGLPVLVSDRGALPATVGQGGVILSLTAGQTAWRDATRRLYFDVVHWGGLSEAAKANSRMTLAGGMKALDDVLMELGQHALSPWQEVLEDDGLE
jgi:glycosyltransferase involved in cell wall biosynthesis